jgi:hypothetical protein
LGSVTKVAMAKAQKLTPQVEKTAVEKWEGIAEKRMMRTICECCG